VVTLYETDSGSREVVDAADYEVLRRDLERAVRRICPRSLAEDAEDLVQEALVKLLRARRLDGDSELSAAYLKKVAYSAVIDEIRRRRRRPAEDAYVDVASAAESVPAAAVDTTLGHAIELGLQHLAPDRRRALTLHLLGYSGSEVAVMLGCNDKRADNLTHRGLAQMREYLLKLGLHP
jgi:RNA polymerase sigma-70 factor (ECF subfamily)